VPQCAIRQAVAAMTQPQPHFYSLSRAPVAAWAFAIHCWRLLSYNSVAALTNSSAGEITAMSLLDKINQEIVAAMKVKDAERLSALRMVKTALKNREIEKMAPLDDAESSRVLQSLVKQRRDSIEQYEKAGRAELAAKEAAEIRVIEEYLPAAVDEATIARVVEETLSEIGATSARDLGRAMKAVMAKFAGQPVDGKVINGLVRAKLGAA
jgi:hypothetical protein